jgi:DNA-binding beta-propeller fold protein YncE
LAIRPDGKQIVIPSIGWPFSLNVVDDPNSAEPKVKRIPPKGTGNVPEVQVHAGVAYSADGKLLYDATGDSGAVDVLSSETWRRMARILLDGLTADVTYSCSFAERSFSR